MSNAQTSAVAAVIRFTGGPDAGIEFELRDEMVNIGQSLDNQIPLTDPTIADHEVSIVARNGRYAIYASRDQFTSVDGNPLPSERWVWLPESAQVSLGSKSVFSFEMTGSIAANSAVETPPAGATTKSIPAPSAAERKPRSGKKSASGKSGEARAKKAVARFITDQVGDPLVKLGEDGQLPELNLTEPGETRKRQPGAKQEQTSPLLVYGAIGFSFLFSILLLILEPNLQGSSSQNDVRQARADIQKFFGSGDGELENYQVLLREAQLAHSRQDFVRERELYRAVLDRLQAEDNQGLIRVTDSRERDEELRKLLAILLTSEE